MPRAVAYKTIVPAPLRFAWLLAKQLWKWLKGLFPDTTAAIERSFAPSNYERAAKILQRSLVKSATISGPGGVDKVQYYAVSASFEWQMYSLVTRFSINDFEWRPEIGIGGTNIHHVPIDELQRAQAERDRLEKEFFEMYKFPAVGLDKQTLLDVEQWRRDVQRRNLLLKTKIRSLFQSPLKSLKDDTSSMSAVEWLAFVKEGYKHLETLRYDPFDR
jgi:hypothetical protein